MNTVDHAEPPVLVPLAIDPAPPPAGSALFHLAGATMGTTWSVRFAIANSALLPAGLRAALEAELDIVVAQMSHWAPDSLLSRYNRAPGGSWHDLPSPFFDVMAYALAMRDLSGGAFDPAAGALVNLWGFGPSGRHDQAGFHAPGADDIDAARSEQAAGRSPPVLDRAARRLLQPGGAVLDLSAIAKGHAVDRLAWCLERHGVRHYLVEIGGELRGAGMKPDGQPWWVEVEAVPDAVGGPAPVVALHGLAIATSGDYRRFYRGTGPDGAAGRIAHTLDPRSGRPVANGVASATVLAQTCMAADAWSTALTVLGADAGLALADAHGVAARLLVRAAGDAGHAPLAEATSAAWRALLQ